MIKKSITKRRSVELRGIARKLLLMADELDDAIEESKDISISGKRNTISDDYHSDALFGHIASSLYRDRRRRNRFFSASLFGEPAWDILLDLFISEAHGKRISVTSSCVASATPLTTALRWLNVLEREKLIERIPNARDARVNWVQLTRHAHLQMTQYLMIARNASASMSPAIPLTNLDESKDQTVPKPKKRSTTKTD